MRQRRKRGQRREVTAPRGKHTTGSRDKGQGNRQAARQPHASWAGTIDVGAAPSLRRHFASKEETPSRTTLQELFDQMLC